MSGRWKGEQCSPVEFYESVQFYGRTLCAPTFSRQSTAILRADASIGPYNYIQYYKQHKKAMQPYRCIALLVYLIESFFAYFLFKESR